MNTAIDLSSAPTPAATITPNCDGCADAIRWLHSLGDAPYAWVRCDVCRRPIALTDGGMERAREKVREHEYDPAVPTGRYAAADCVWYGRWTALFEGRASTDHGGDGGRLTSTAEDLRTDEARQRAHEINQRLRRMRLTAEGSRYEAALRYVYIERGGVYERSKDSFWEHLGWILASPEQRVIWQGRRTHVRPSLPRRYGRRVLREAVDAYDALCVEAGPDLTRDKRLDTDQIPAHSTHDAAEIRVPAP